MNNFDLEKLLSENYCDTLNSFEQVDKERLYNIYKEPKRSSTGVRIVRFQVAAIAAAIVLGMVGTAGAVAAGTTFRDNLFNEAREDNVSLSDEELDEIVSRLEDLDSPYLDKTDLPEIGENENGQNYGTFLYGLELTTVSAKDMDGNLVVGYCYSEDFNILEVDFDKYDDVLKWQEAQSNGLVRNWFYVFDEDGVTIIGKFFGALNSESGEILEAGLRSSGFITNDRLATGSYDKYLHDGSDAEEYEAIVQERINSILK